jgi:methanogenic corrinoid protein MtbC1
MTRLKELVGRAIAANAKASEIVDHMLVGMNAVGEKFKNNEVYVPEVLVAARAMNAGMQLLKPILAEEGTKTVGKACLGTVRGDLHDIGKNLVKIMLEGKGIEVIDLGTDVEPELFVNTAKEQNCDLICCSALLTTTMSVIKEVVTLAEEAGIRDKVKIMIGGAPISEAFCNDVGADVYTSDAASCADKAYEICSKIKR